MPYKTKWTANEILAIVKKWTTVAKLKELNKTAKGKTEAGDDKILYIGIDKFYKDINMKQHNKTISVVPFFEKAITPAFDSEVVNLADFKVFCEGLNKLIYKGPKLGFNNLYTAKAALAKALTKYRDRKDTDNEFVKAFNANDLRQTKQEYDNYKDVARKRADAKNRDILYIPQEKVEHFYRLFCYKPEGDIIDKILEAGCCLGLRYRSLKQ